MTAPIAAPFQHVGVPPIFSRSLRESRPLISPPDIPLPTNQIAAINPAVLVGNTISNTGIEYGIMKVIMATARKITVEIPQALLAKAQQASGSGITQTVRTGLELLAASQAYDRLRQMRGKVRFSRTFRELKEDR